MAEPAMTKRDPHLVEIEISALNAYGQGVGALGDRQVFVHGAVPGDLARLRLGKPHPRYVEATLFGIVRPSPARRATLPCPIWRPECACPLMPLSDAAQAAHKRDLVVRAFADAGAPGIERIAPCEMAAETVAYRSKVVLVAQNHRGGLRLGGYRRGSHEVLDLAGCVIEEPVLARLAARLRQALSALGVSAYDGGGDLRYVVMRSNGAGEALLTFIGRASLTTWAGGLAEALRAEVSHLRGVFCSENTSAHNAIWTSPATLLSGDRVLIEHVAGLDFAISPEAFFQVHRAQAHQLRRRLSDEIAGALKRQDLRGVSIWDLFCGVGVNALWFAKQGAAVIGVEGHSQAIDDANANAARNQLAAQFIVADLDQPFDFNAALPDVIVLNPPRRGAASALIERLAELRPSVIAYIACAPKPLAQAAARLARAGYVAQVVIPFDLFPHTEHVETLTVFTRG